MSYSIKKELHIGIVGYSSVAGFDVSLATEMINEAYDILEKRYPVLPKVLVSGLTNIGIPKIAYEQASLRGWKTKGVACSLASEHPLFPVDEKLIIGDHWGGREC